MKTKRIIYKLLSLVLVAVIICLSFMVPVGASVAITVVGVLSAIVVVLGLFMTTQTCIRMVQDFNDAFPNFWYDVGIHLFKIQEGKMIFTMGSAAFTLIKDWVLDWHAENINQAADTISLDQFIADWSETIYPIIFHGKVAHLLDGKAPSDLTTSDLQNTVSEIVYTPATSPNYAVRYDDDTMQTFNKQLTIYKKANSVYIGADIQIYHEPEGHIYCMYSNQPTLNWGGSGDEYQKTVAPYIWKNAYNMYSCTIGGISQNVSNTKKVTYTSTGGWYWDGNGANLTVDANGNIKAGSTFITTDTDYNLVSEYIFDLLYTDTYAPGMIDKTEGQDIGTQLAIDYDLLAEKLLDANGELNTGVNNMVDSIVTLNETVEAIEAEITTPDIPVNSSFHGFKFPAVLMTKFPFCLPFDLEELAQELIVPAVKPDFSFTITLPYVNEEWTVDLSFIDNYDWIFAVIRYFILLFFIVALIYATKQIIWG